MKNLFLLVMFAAQIANADWKLCEPDLLGEYNYLIQPAIMKDGNRILVGSSESIFISTDDGDNWRRSSNHTDYVSSLIRKGNVLFAGTKNGVYISEDNGANWNWSIIPNYLQGGMSIYQVYFVKDLGDRVIVSTDIGRFSTTDLGKSWSKHLDNFPDKAMKSLTISGNNWIGVSWFVGGIYLSQDSGVTWKRYVIKANGYDINSMISISASGRFVFGNAETISRDYPHGKNKPYIFFSENYGVDFTLSYNEEFNLGYINCVLADSNRAIIGATKGIYIFDPETKTIDSTNIKNATIYSIIKSEDSFYALGENIIYKSTDNGKSWTEGRRSNINYPTFDLTSDDEIIYAANEIGVFSTYDSGVNWNWITSNMPNRSYKKIAAKGQYLAAVSQQDSIFYSQDKGLTWQNTIDIFPNKVGSNFIQDLLVNNNYIYAVTESGLYVSGDQGSTWNLRQVGNIPDNECLAFEFKGDSLFTGKSSNTLYFTTDNGMTWETIDTKISNGYISDIAFSGDKIALAVGKSILVSNSEGKDFETQSVQYNSYLYEETNVLINGDTILCHLDYNYNKYVTVSGNNGKTWLDLWYLGNNESVNDVVWEGDNILVGTELGIYRSKLSDFGKLFGVNDPIAKENPISVYPNPAGEIINVSLYGDSKGIGFPVRIYDMVGNLVLTSDSQKRDNFTISVRSLSSGVYNLKIGDNRCIFIKD